MAPFVCEAKGIMYLQIKYIHIQFFNKHSCYSIKKYFWVFLSPEPQTQAFLHHYSIILLPGGGNAVRTKRLPPAAAGVQLQPHQEQMTAVQAVSSSPTLLPVCHRIKHMQCLDTADLTGKLIGVQTNAELRASKKKKYKYEAYIFKVMGGKKKTTKKTQKAKLLFPKEKGQRNKRNCRVLSFHCESWATCCLI